MKTYRPLYDWCALLLPLLTAVLVAPCSEAAYATAGRAWDAQHAVTPYDDEFKKAWKMFWRGRGVDWRLFRNQVFHESSFRADAVSYANAQGLAQFLEPTWKEVQHALPELAGKTPFDAKASILAQSFYMLKLWQTWQAERPVRDRALLAVASYNAGPGNILKAQRRCQRTSDGDCDRWQPIVDELPHITGAANARTTRTYAEGIVLVPFVAAEGPAAHGEDDHPQAVVPLEFARLLDSLTKQELDLILSLMKLFSK